MFWSTTMLGQHSSRDPRAWPASRPAQERLLSEGQVNYSVPRIVCLRIIPSAEPSPESSAGSQSKHEPLTAHRRSLDSEKCTLYPKKRRASTIKCISRRAMLFYLRCQFYKVSRISATQLISSGDKPFAPPLSHKYFADCRRTVPLPADIKSLSSDY